MNSNVTLRCSQELDKIYI
ncbi:hypothetical protein J7E66_21870 [Bacillus sp. ISL-7]|nr:hypothetical protein [Bacillus sp. ISL-7]